MCINYLFKIFYQAVETLKTFEKKDSRVKSAAATNLSFLHFLVRLFDVFHFKLDNPVVKTVESQAGTSRCFPLTFNLQQEKEYEQAERYADLAMNADRYNPAALINKGNTLFVKQDYEKAAEFYKEALRNDSSCTEALYNLGNTCFYHIGVHSFLTTMDTKDYSFESRRTLLKGC